jgi:hypothetical protein
MARLWNRRFVLVLVAGVLAALLTPLDGAASPAVAGTRVTGTLLVSPSEDGSAPEYALVLDDGDMLPVDGDLEGVAPRSKVTLERGEVVSARTSAPATAPSVHRVFVLAPSNLGTFPMTDAQMLEQVQQAADFWVDEADGAILDFDLPTTVTRYAPKVASADNKCGLDLEFFDVMDEARAVFPTADFVDGTDHLVLLAPSACKDESTAGRAVLGDSLYNGGYQVSFVQDAFTIGTLAHEWGHNFGLMHSNIGDCDELGCSGEYANLYNVMGRGTLPSHNRLTALSTAFRSIAGVLAANEVAEVPKGDGSDEVSFTRRIVPRSSETGVRAVSVLDPDSGHQLFVEYRSGTAQDAGSAYALGYDLGSTRFDPGVVIEHPDDRAVSLETSLDGLTTSFDDQTWTNGSGTLSVTAGPIADGGVDVTVHYQPGSGWSGPLTASIEGTPAVNREVSVLTNAGGRLVQWLLDGDPVPGATEHQLRLAPEHVGHELAVEVTEYEYGKGFRTVVSDPVEVEPGTLRYYDPPRITGTAEVGRTLSTNGAIWDSASFDGPTATSFQWLVGGMPVAGATGKTYVVRTEDSGKRIAVRETGTRPGYANLAVTSDPTAVVPEPAQPPLSPAPTPTVSGTPQVDKVLTAVAGSWPAGTTLTFQWHYGTGPISGATGPTYTPKPSDVGLWVRVSVTGTKAGFHPTTRTSARTDPVAKGVLAAVRPTITGKTRVGKTLRAVTGTWTPTPKFRYQWKANGKKIRGATGVKLVLQAGQRGKRITVTVTGTRAGYVTTSRTSSATRKVRR